MMKHLALATALVLTATVAGAQTAPTPKVEVSVPIGSNAWLIIVTDSARRKVCYITASIGGITGVTPTAIQCVDDVR